ncbi:transcriptional regulator [Mesorhizobium sp. L-8-10]|uniref:ArsR/SmtB family transcription factor n=1 Tax=Mesorhizobium sp. L-8-10 TaxID=2744523 RepID=UPI00192818A9|nr:metalloregulator ArsR/SmtB family transcription factor [Mesorhizobium sp. L-8-10]BCH33626.1 transcriptional regulator [Mesorhizobium sp. L-8-10]
MEKEQAILAFAALAQSTRLDVFRLLIGHEPHGLPAGDIARHMAVPHNTMSTHLAVLARAGLIEAERQSRSIVYRARLDAVRALAGYLLKDCCGGRPEICEPLIADLSPCCPPNHPALEEVAHD